MVILLVLLHRQLIISAIRRLRTEIGMVIQSVHQQHQQTISAIRQLPIVTNMEMRRVLTNRAPTTLEIPIPLTQTLMAIQEVLLRLPLITSVTRRQHIRIRMEILLEHQPHRRIILEIAIQSSVATIAIRPSGVGKAIAVQI